MSWAGVGVAIAGAASTGASAYMNSEAADDAAGALAKSGNEYERRLDDAANDVEDYSREYVGILQTMNEDFDPYAMEQAFNSLYEAVIMPMERDFDENVLPGIRAAYSGGIMGAGAGLSGASQQAEANARRDLSENTAQLKFAERKDAIALNYAEWDRRTNVLDKSMQANLLSPYMRADQAAPIYKAQTSTIAAQLAAKQAQAAIPNQMFSAALQGYQAGSSMSGDGEE